MELPQSRGGANSRLGRARGNGLKILANRAGTRRQEIQVYGGVQCTREFLSGKNGSGASETKHWQDMITKPRQTIVQWHRLKPE